MAELALKHISSGLTGPSKEYIRTTELFFDKVFGDHAKFNHDFATKKGVFSADHIEISYQDGKSKIFKNVKDNKFSTTINSISFTRYIFYDFS